MKRKKRQSGIARDGETMKKNGQVNDSGNFMVPIGSILKQMLLNDLICSYVINGQSMIN